MYKVELTVSREALAHVLRAHAAAVLAEPSLRAMAPTDLAIQNLQEANADAFRLTDDDGDEGLCAPGDAGWRIYDALGYPICVSVAE